MLSEKWLRIIIIIINISSTHHGSVAVSEPQRGVREGLCEGAEGPVVQSAEGAVHVRVTPCTPRALAHSVAAQHVDGLVQAVLHFVLLQRGKKGGKGYERGKRRGGVRNGIRKRRRKRSRGKVGERE